MSVGLKINLSFQMVRLQRFDVIVINTWIILCATEEGSMWFIYYKADFDSNRVQTRKSTQKLNGVNKIRKRENVQ